MFPTKKIILLTLSTIIIGSLFVMPAFAQDKQASYCWTKEYCEENSQRKWVKDKTGKECPAGSGFCYYKNDPINLQIPIGALKESKGLGDYIPAIYNYLVAIVSIVAIVVIMVGGMQILTAGGSAEKVGKGKERILGAVIGLFLALGSYTILKTVNPALVNLKLPELKLISPESLTNWCPNESKYVCGGSFKVNNKSCIGQYCDKGNGCFKMGYDEKTPNCTSIVAGKACANLKKLASKCPETNTPTSDDTCKSVAIIKLNKNDLNNLGIKMELADIRTIKLSYERYSETILLNKDEKSEDNKYLNIHLCSGGKIGCNGPDKVLIDRLCKNFDSFKGDSPFFKVFP